MNNIAIIYDVEDINDIKFGSLFFEKIVLDKVILDDFEISERTKHSISKYCVFNEEDKDLFKMNGMFLLLGDFNDALEFQYDLNFDIMTGNYYKRGFNPVLVGANKLKYRFDYSNNDDSEISNSTLYSVLLNEIPIIDFDTVSFENILELRSDKISKLKIIRLREFVTKEIGNNKSLSQIIDDINIKIEDYKFALKKHGCETKIGYINQIVNYKDFIKSISPLFIGQLTGNELTGLIASGLIISGSMTINFIENKIKSEEIKNKFNKNEIAILYDIIKK